MTSVWGGFSSYKNGLMVLGCLVYYDYCDSIHLMSVANLASDGKDAAVDTWLALSSYDAISSSAGASGKCNC